MNISLDENGLWQIFQDKPPELGILYRKLSSGLDVCSTSIENYNFKHLCSIDTFGSFLTDSIHKYRQLGDVTNLNFNDPFNSDLVFFNGNEDNNLLDVAYPAFKWGNNSIICHVPL